MTSSSRTKLFVRPSVTVRSPEALPDPQLRRPAQPPEQQRQELATSNDNECAANSCDQSCNSSKIGPYVQRVETPQSAKDNMAQKSSSNQDSSQTLGDLLTHLEGIELIVELKTGRRLRGTLSSSDYNMNLTLENVEEEGTKGDEGGKKEDYSGSGEELIDISTSLNIRGSKIRYIHFPDNADLTGLVRTGVDRQRAAANKYRRGKRKA
jgi:small nuclear ribonucleoprotein (snRNP)-like protein